MIQLCWSVSVMNKLFTSFPQNMVIKSALNGHPRQSLLKRSDKESSIASLMRWNHEVQSCLRSRSPCSKLWRLLPDAPTDAVEAVSDAWVTGGKSKGDKRADLMYHGRFHQSSTDQMRHGSIHWQKWRWRLVVLLSRI